MPHEIWLRDVMDDDLPVFFAQQQDMIACEMAGFPTRDREAFHAHWAKILVDTTVLAKTIVADGQVVGNIGYFQQGDNREVCYWLGQEFWGRGIATEALTEFLKMVPERPLFAHIVKHNTASRRVLEKCGFVLSEAAGDEELALTLAANSGTITGL